MLLPYDNLMLICHYAGFCTTKITFLLVTHSEAKNDMSIVYKTVMFEGTQKCKYLIKYYFYFTSILVSTSIVAITYLRVLLQGKDFYG